jgi:RAT1-interacting protein
LAECNTNIQFCSIFATQLGEFSIVCGGEVDCYQIKSNGRDGYAELKTNRIIASSKQHYSFVKHKLLKTWTQSFLAGVETVIFGFRDDGIYFTKYIDGILKSIKKYATNDLQRLARENNAWDPNVCMTFASKVLGFIKDTVIVDDRETVYTMKYDHRSKEITLSAPVHGGSNIFVQTYKNT